jgi:hypothetical protein
MENKCMDITNNEAFENGYASGKADGFKEAWELAGGILYDYSTRDLEEMFGTINHSDIFSFPVEYVRKCFEEYRNRIKVGDVVKSHEYVGVVIQKNSTLIRILTKTSTGNAVVAAVPVDETVKLAEGVESFSDILENIKYVNE